ncbi:MAG: hypothetical protein ACYTHJ_23185 [Planctomycetota bacterium]|jgi:hypothetical protein
MDDRIQDEMRNAAIGRRVPPGRATRIVLKPDGKGLFPETLEPGALVLQIEATTPSGELASWYVDEWWSEVIAHLADRDVAVHFEPSPSSILHPVVMHHVSMLRRVVTHWRVVGYGYRSDVMSDDDVAVLATSGFHELRFLDVRRTNAAHPDRQLFDQPIEDLFARIRRVQQARGATRPILVRVATGAGAKSDVVSPSATTSSYPST